MSVEVIIAVVGALAWLPSVYGIIEAVRRRKDKARQALDEGDRMVVKSAISLLAPYEKRVAELESKLSGANNTITTLKGQLDDATHRATVLNNQLVDAQTEIGYLRIQVKTLSQQLNS
jgi:uncharacterized coiled-coil protein SlyX